jgi:hypothetical protein
MSMSESIYAHDHVCVHVHLHGHGHGYVHASAFSFINATVRCKNKSANYVGLTAKLLLDLVDYANSFRQNRFNCCEDAETGFMLFYNSVILNFKNKSCWLSKLSERIFWAWFDPSKFRRTGPFTKQTKQRADSREDAHSTYSILACHLLKLTKDGAFPRVVYLLTFHLLKIMYSSNSRRSWSLNRLFEVANYRSV